MDFLTVVFIAVPVLWFGLFWYGNGRIAAADEDLRLQTQLNAFEARQIIDRAGKPRNPMALNKPEWHGSSVWMRKFDRGVGNKHSDALLKVEILPPPGGSNGKVVVVASIEGYSGYRRLGLKMSDALNHSLSVRKKILKALAGAA